MRGPAPKITGRIDARALMDPEERTENPRIDSIMRRIVLSLFLIAGATVSPNLALAQVDYKVVDVSAGGTISGSVKWVGAIPHSAPYPIARDTGVCDPESHKATDLERLILGPQGGVANTVVYLKNISSGKALDLPPQRRHLDQRACRYVPHIMIVPAGSDLVMNSSDATLHTVHMDGAATFNLSFPFPNRPNTRTMTQPGIVHLRCNGGHVWMNAEMMVVTHPYYAVTDESGEFQLTNVPPGTYQVVAWHEGWGVQTVRSVDFSTQSHVERPIFSDAKVVEKSVTVLPKQATVVNFTLGAK